MNTPPTAPRHIGQGVAFGSLGDIEMGNRVVSVNGVKISTGKGNPSNTVGNWHAGDVYIDNSRAAGNVWVFSGTAWTKPYPAQGAVLTAANNLTLGTDGNFFLVNGNTQINLIDRSKVVGGQQITLRFLGSPLIKYDQPPSGTFVPMFLQGSVDFAATSVSTLTLVYDSSGDAWWEVARKT